MAQGNHTVFHLLPQNDNARAIVSDPRNSHFAEPLPNGSSSIRIGLEHSPKRPDTLVSLGNEACDIYLPDNLASKYQCCFEIHPKSGELILHDMSPDCTTWLTYIVADGQGHTLPVPGWPRKQVVLSSNPASICIRYSTIIFALCLPDQRQKTSHEAKMNFVRRHGPKPGCPRRRRYKERIAYQTHKSLGHGGYGDVYLVTDLHSGDQLAMKTFKKRKRETDQDYRWRIRNEVELFKLTSHVSSFPTSIPSISRMYPGLTFKSLA